MIIKKRELYNVLQLKTMFKFTDIEFHDWKSQIVMSNAVNDINEDTRLQIELINQSR